MTAEEYLGQIRWLDDRIRFNLRSVENLRQMAESISPPSPDAGRVRTSKAEEAPYAPLIRNIRDLQTELNDEVDRLVDLRRQAREVIHTLGDNELEMILNHYYIEGMGWERIGSEMHMDRSTALRKHDRAIARIVVPEDAIRI